MASMEFYLFLPQMRMELPALVERAQAAEAAGFTGMALMDHLAPPMALDQPMYEAMTTAMFLATRTTTLRVGHLVLCDAFRQPTVLAREAVTIDHASGGRFDFGIGWGSVSEEFVTYGTGSTEAKARVGRLGESLAVMTALWSGELSDFTGEYHTLVAAQQRPTPIDHMPIVIGGAGPKTLDLVARYADWWNLPLHRLGELDKMRDRAGSARISTQEMVGFSHTGDDLEEIKALMRKRWGSMSGKAVGAGPQLVDHFGSRAEQGIERVYVWFSDFAKPETLASFGAGVISQFG